jgi:hypothetical protein
MKTLSPLAAVLALAFLASGCGGSPKAPQVASLVGGATPTTTTTAGAGPSLGGSSGGAPSGGSFRMVMKTQHGLQFSRCMRSHGVSKFPDPGGDGSIEITGSAGIDPRSPTFEKAQQACQRLIGGGKPASPAEEAKARRQALAFSACMRHHGIADFPDPDFSGGRIGIRIDGGPGSDLDPHSPAFQAAQQACQGFMKGPNAKGKG